MKQTINPKYDMRTIRFRGKGKDGTWWHGSLALFKDQHEAYIIPDVIEAKDPRIQYGLVSVSLDTVGQFTGMHDKYGAEIYEGDIVRYYDDIEDELVESHVVYNKDTCSFCAAPSKLCGDYVGITAYWQFEVIGNIHEKGGKA